MTLFMLLEDTRANLLEQADTTPLMWRDRPFTPEEVTRAGRYPYVRVKEHDETPQTRLHGNQEVMSRLYDVIIYQSADNGHTPDGAMATALYQRLLEVRHKVTRLPYGEKLTAVSLEGGHRPQHDPNTKGLMGFVRLRCSLARG